MCHGTDQWDVIEVPFDEFKLGACNNVVLGNRKVVLEEKAHHMIESIEKRNYSCVGVGYSNLYTHFGSGIHCSTASLHREYVKTPTK